MVFLKSPANVDSNYGMAADAAVPNEEQFIGFKGSNVEHLQAIEPEKIIPNRNTLKKNAFDSDL